MRDDAKGYSKVSGGRNPGAGGVDSRPHIRYRAGFLGSDGYIPRTSVSLYQSWGKLHNPLRSRNLALTRRRTAHSPSHSCGGRNPGAGGVDSRPRIRYRAGFLGSDGYIPRTSISLYQSWGKLHNPLRSRNLALTRRRTARSPLAVLQP